jgi:hypothetical protein
MARIRTQHISRGDVTADLSRQISRCDVTFSRLYTPCYSETKDVITSKKNILWSITPPHPRKSYRYEMLWKTIVEPNRPQMTTWRMRFACWTAKATNTTSEYVKTYGFCTAAVDSRARLGFTLIRTFFVVFRIWPRTPWNSYSESGTEFPIIRTSNVFSARFEVLTAVVLSAGMWCFVVWRRFRFSLFVFRVRAAREASTTWPWKWGDHNSSTHRELDTRYGVISQKTFESSTYFLFFLLPVEIASLGRGT